MKMLVKKGIILVLPLIVIVAFVYVFDPYFHFHKPYEWVSYQIDSGYGRYTENGVLKNFNYDIIVTGSSYDETTKTSVVDRLYHGTSVKCTLPGASYAEIRYAMDTAFQSGNNIRMVFCSLNYHKQLICGENEWPEFEYPRYLYDNNPFNDGEYIFNSETVNKCLINLKKTIKGEAKTTFDMEHALSDELYGKTQVISGYERLPYKLAEVPFTDKAADMVRRNITKNIVMLAKEHPKTTFYLYYPPTPILFWDYTINEGVFDQTLEAIRLTTELLLECPNIKLYYFINDTDVTFDLNNYKDIFHFGHWINTKILADMSKGLFRMTEDNYEACIEMTRSIYGSFDYDNLLDAAREDK